MAVAAAKTGAAPTAAAPETTGALAVRMRTNRATAQRAFAAHERSTLAGGPAPVREAAPAGVQTQLLVSSPGDAAEREAEAMGRHVANMPDTAPPATAPQASASRRTALRRATAAPVVTPNIAGRLASVATGGNPLPARTRSFMEPRFGADFGGVRIHTGAEAAGLSSQLSAQAFTLGRDIYFGRNQFQPDTRSGRELIAHELTHTIQQGSAIQRAPDGPRVWSRSPPAIHRSVAGDALDYIGDHANLIPGFRMLTIVLGMNPVTMKPVDRSPSAILKALVELIPGGSAIVAALENSGIFDKAAAMLAEQVAALGMTAGMFRAAIDRFIATLDVTDIFSPGATWERAKRILSEPIDRLIAFGKGLANTFLKLIKDAILSPLAKLAEPTRGWDLLIQVLGRNPITGEPVTRTPEGLIGGFLKLIGQDEIWENMRKANAVPRAYAWFQGAMATLSAFVAQLPALFLQAFTQLTIEDVVLIVGAFRKIAGVFGGFAVQFVTWAGEAIWTLLEIIFDVVSPGALVYVKKTGAALKSILQDPKPFVGNLAKAAKLGLSNFTDHFGTHLKAGLIDWLVGALPGVYIPQALSLVEIGKFALSVLGVSWAQIRGKIVKALGPTGETIMKGLEAGFDVVVALIKDGPAAAWELIKDKLGNLKDMVIDGIESFVVDTIVQKAIPKLIAMFIPGAGFISAILSIYDTVMVFVQKLAKMAAAVKAFVDSIVAIAAGEIGGAAAKVESALSGVLSLAISFLAGFLGLGNVSAKIMAVVQKVRATVDHALDVAIAWIVTKAKALFGKLFGKKDDKRTEAEKLADLDKAIAEAEALRAKPQATEAKIRKGLPAIKKKYDMVTLDLIVDGETDAEETVHFFGEINPKKPSKTGKVPKTPGDSKKNPIPIKWVKPPVSGYPSIKIGAKSFSPLGGGSVGGLGIGVSHPTALAIAPGAVIQAQAPVTGNSVKDSMNRTLNAAGYDRDLGAGAPRDNDHIVEKQLGGPDDTSNLWPLNESVNRSSGSTIRGEISRIKDQYNIPSLANKWLKLT